MNFLKVSLFILLFSFNSFAQKDTSLLSLVNICRTEPNVFLSDYVLPYLENHKDKNSSYTRSLVRELKSLKAIEGLQTSLDLNQMAKDYAETMGKKGFTGHKMTINRFQENNVQYEYIGENCSYGFNNSLDILMQLLIDEGESDLGHRKNLLNPNFEYIGIAIAPHKKLTWNCVMEFGGN